MGRSVLAVLAGIVTAFIVVMASQMLGHALFPLPEGIDPMDSEALEQAMAAGRIPIASLLAVAIGYLIASFAGGFVAGKIAARRGLVLGAVVGSVMVLATLWNLVMIPHPVWFWFVGLLPQIPLAVFAAKVAAPTR